MHDDLGLLERGKSVKRKRSLQVYMDAGRKLGLGMAVAAALAVALTILTRGLAPGTSYPDGLPSTNREAAAYCDRAMKILHGSLYMELGEAWTNFHQAIALDPNFVQPYVGLLEMDLREHFPGMPEKTRETTEDIATHLEQMAPRLAATHCAKSILAYKDYNFPEAEREVLEATKANPNYELGHTWHSWLLLCFGRPDESLEEYKITQAILLSHVIIFWGRGTIYYVKRDFTNATNSFKQALNWQPQHLGALDGMGDSCIALGDYSKAMDYFEKEEVFSGRQDEASAKRGHQILSSALEKGGTNGFWQQLWEWETNKPQNFYYKAEIQIHLGNTGPALDFLQKDWEAKKRNPNYDSYVHMVLHDDCWDGLHDNPRFKKLLDEIGLTKVMPPQKR
jgi:tetratricopeptide (TPR) repeat protein